jgi:O-antigen/teichoic acid export membrane protein
MSRGRELIKNTGILFFGKASTQVISFLLLPLYTAILSTYEYGQLDIYSSFVMILLPVVTLQLEQGIFRYMLTSDDRSGKEQVLSSGIVTITTIIAGYSLLYFISAQLFHFQYPLVLYFYYFTLVINSVLLQVCRGFGNNVGYSISIFISAVVVVVLNIVFIAQLRLGAWGALYSSIIGNLISCIYICVITHLPSYVKLDKINISRIKKMLQYSVPLILNQISSWVINYSDRVIILTILGMSFNGIYSLANKFSNLMNTFFGVYNLAWTENVIKYTHDNDDNKNYLNKVITLTFKIYLCVVILIINILPILFRYFINSNYNDAYQHIPILLVGMFFSGMAATLGSIYIAYQRTKDVSITTFLSGVLNITINLVLINFIGLYAASISTLIAFMVLFFYRYFDMQKFERISIKIDEIGIPVLILILSWSFYSIKNTRLILLGLILNIIYLSLLCKKNTQNIIRLFKRQGEVV